MADETYKERVLREYAEYQATQLAMYGPLGYKVECPCRAGYFGPDDAALKAAARKIRARTCSAMERNAMLGIAAEEGHRGCMARLAKLGATNYNFALICAARFYRLDCVRWAIKKGVSPWARNVAFLTSMRLDYWYPHETNPLPHPWYDPPGYSLNIAKLLYHEGVGDTSIALAYQASRMFAFVCGAIPYEDIVEPDWIEFSDANYYWMLGWDWLLCYRRKRRYPERVDDDDPRREWIMSSLAWLKLVRSERIHPRILHARLLDVAIALAASGLPPYCLVWVTDWAYPGALSHRARVRLFEGVCGSRRKYAERESARCVRSTIARE